MIIRGMDGVTTLRIFQQMTDLVFVMSVHEDREFRYSFLNDSAMKVSGLHQDAYGASFFDVVKPSEATFLHNQYARAMTTKSPLRFMMNHEGQVGESLVTPIMNPIGQCTHVIGTVRDITERYQKEQYLESIAFHDQLTGILNRRAFYTQLEHTVASATESGQLLGVLLLDCDNLKPINDRYGHVVGDLMLKKIAQRMEHAVPSSLLARIGGDEFLMVVPLHAEIELVMVAERILHDLRKPWTYDEFTFYISMSIGTATYPIAASDIHEVIRAADQAMYKAKKRGGNKYWFERNLSI